MIKTPIEKEIFVKKNLALVHSLANRFRGRGIEYDDLFGAGCVGLVKAIDGFDEDRGFMFSTYAVPVILGEIKRLFRDGGAIKVSRSLKEISMKVIKEKDNYISIHGFEPSLSELAKILDITVEIVVEALNVSQPPMSLTCDDDGNSEFDIPTNNHEEFVCNKISLENIITNLEQIERNLIILRYFKNKTQSQTADILNMTQVQVSRKEKKILQKLKIKLS